MMRNKILHFQPGKQSEVEYQLIYLIVDYSIDNSSDIIVYIIHIFDVTLGKNGDKLVGEWKATVSGTIINCERSDTINNGYICAFSGYQIPVTWDANVFTWNNGVATGTITNNVMTWSTGSIWEKQNVPTTTTTRM